MIETPRYTPMPPEYLVKAPPPAQKIDDRAKGRKPFELGGAEPAVTIPPEIAEPIETLAPILGTPQYNRTRKVIQPPAESTFRGKG